MLEDTMQKSNRIVKMKGEVVKQIAVLAQNVNLSLRK